MGCPGGLQFPRWKRHDAVVVDNLYFRLAGQLEFAGQRPDFLAMQDDGLPRQRQRLPGRIDENAGGQPAGGFEKKGMRNHGQILVSDRLRAENRKNPVAFPYCSRQLPARLHFCTRLIKKGRRNCSFSTRESTAAYPPAAISLKPYSSSSQTRKGRLPPRVKPKRSCICQNAADSNSCPRLRGEAR